jgi:hypothetical protein
VLKQFFFFALFSFEDHARSVFIRESLLVLLSLLTPLLLFRNACLLVLLTCHYVLRLGFFLFTFIVFLACYVVTTRHSPVVLLWLQTPCQCNDLLRVAVLVPTPVPDADNI